MVRTNKGYCTWSLPSLPVIEVQSAGEVRGEKSDEALFALFGRAARQSSSPNSGLVEAAVREINLSLPIAIAKRSGVAFLHATGRVARIRVVHGLIFRPSTKLGLAVVALEVWC